MAEEESEIEEREKKKKYILFLKKISYKQVSRKFI